MNLSRSIGVTPVVLSLLALASCRSHRVLHVESTPPGAVVRLDEVVIGTTPCHYEFIHGGQRRLSLYLDDHRTWSRLVDLELPWYARFPADLFTEVLLPLGLDQDFDFAVRLTPDTKEEDGDAPALDAHLTRARQRWASEREGND